MKTFIITSLAVLIVSLSWHYHEEKIKYCFYAKGVKDGLTYDVVSHNVIREWPYVPLKADLRACALIGENL